MGAVAAAAAPLSCVVTRWQSSSSPSPDPLSASSAAAEEADDDEDDEEDDKEDDEDDEEDEEAAASGLGTVTAVDVAEKGAPPRMPIARLLGVKMTPSSQCMQKSWEWRFLFLLSWYGGWGGKVVLVAWSIATLALALAHTSTLALTPILNPHRLLKFAPGRTAHVARS